MCQMAGTPHRQERESKAWQACSAVFELLQLHWMAVQWEESSKWLIWSNFSLEWASIREFKKKKKKESTDSVWVSRRRQVIMFAIVIHNYTRTKQTDLTQRVWNSSYCIEERRNHKPGANDWAFQRLVECLSYTLSRHTHLAGLLLYFVTSDWSRSRKRVLFAQPLHKSLLSTFELSPLSQTVSHFLGKLKKKKKVPTGVLKCVFV